MQSVTIWTLLAPEKQIQIHNNVLSTDISDIKDKLDELISQNKTIISQNETFASMLTSVVSAPVSVSLTQPSAPVPAQPTTSYYPRSLSPVAAPVSSEYHEYESSLTSTSLPAFSTLTQWVNSTRFELAKRLPTAKATAEIFPTEGSPHTEQGGES